jgi:phosphoglucosamine mutase
MARKLFGTDGIRGVAGEYPLNRSTAYAVGAALGACIRQSGGAPEVVIGMDTRESGPWLAEHVSSGLGSQDIQVRFAGVTATPGVAYLAKNGNFSAGVMISASHNPYRDNGIKILGKSGYKLPDLEEEQLESEIFRFIAAGGEPRIRPLAVDEGLDRTYIDHLAGTLPRPVSGLKIVADCANGSVSHLAPDLLSRVGAEVITIGASPDGRNINLDCGSLHLGKLRRTVLDQSADLGVAYDGDADRALFVSHSGKIVDGDAVLFLVARYLKEQGRLPVPLVVATVMSNLGLELALAAQGIDLIRTAVGDKYVLEEMLRLNASLGGEQSGHVIFRDYATTGDGILTTLRVLEVLNETGRNLDDLITELQIFPQLLVNVKVKSRKPIEDMPLVVQSIHAAEDSFGKEGRVLVRFSGTEPLARVMVEGRDQQRVEFFAHDIAAQIQSALGVDSSSV